MRVTNPSRVEARFYSRSNSTIKVCDLSDAEVVRRSRLINQARNRFAHAQLGKVMECAVPKPDWFLAAEKRARRFVKGLGLLAAKGQQVILADVAGLEQSRTIFPHDSETHTTDAQYDKYFGVVMRYSLAEQAHREGKGLAIRAILTHELVHSAEYIGKTMTQIYDPAAGAWSISQRAGFQLGEITASGQAIERGAFFDEGIAEFAGSLLVRRAKDPTCSLISFDELPPPELPSHYLSIQLDKGVPYTAGYDAYAMELLAWGTQKKGVLAADDFIGALLDSHSLDQPTRLKAFRTVATSTDKLEPGLYPYLRDLTHTRENWQDGLAAVYRAVS